MAFSLRQLQYFMAVAEAGSISGAAHGLSISQSTVTEAIKDLEQDLGVPLFERHARGLAITRKGQQFLRHAAKIMADVSDARRTLAEPAGRGSAGGRLHLGVTSVVAAYVLSDILARFRRACPEVQVTAIEDAGEYLEHLLVGGELDLAILTISSLHDTSALMTELLDVSHYRLWLPSGHPLIGRERVTLDDLAEEPVVLLDMDEIEEAVERLWADRLGKPAMAFRTRSVEAVRSLVATGAGVAILPDLVYRPWSLEGDRIVACAIAEALPAMAVGLAWRRGAPVSGVTQQFIDLACSQQRLR
jgi:DNA-binding transcriptional LysR family regulator